MDNEKFKTRIRLIPAKSIVGEKILIGIRSDRITLGAQNRIIENAVIAIDDDSGTFGGYSVLVPSCFLDKGD